MLCAYPPVSVQYIFGGADTPNMREDVLEAMRCVRGHPTIHPPAYPHLPTPTHLTPHRPPSRRKGLRCKCIRCREVMSREVDPDSAQLVERRYPARATTHALFEPCSMACVLFD